MDTKTRLRRWLSVAAVLLPVAMAVQVLAPRLADPLWYDEALTVLDFLNLPTYGAIWHCYPVPNNHIAYTMALRLWCDTVGWLIPNSVVVELRLFSLLTALAVVALCAWSWRRRLGSALAGIAAFALAASAPMWIYGAAVRGYVLSLLTGTLALHAVLRLRRGQVVSGTVLYAASALLAVATIPTNLLFFVALAPAVILAPAAGPRWRRCALAVLPAATLLFYAPIWDQLLAAARAGHGWRDAGACARHLYGASAIVFLPFLLAALAGAALRCLPRRSGLSRVHGSPWLVTAAALGLPALVIACLRPAPFPRTFVIFLPLWLFLAGDWARHLFAWLRLRYRRRAWPMMTSLFFIAVALWASLLAERRSVVAAWFRPSPFSDELILPPYLADFRPEAIVDFAAHEYERDSRVRFVVTPMGDPFALLVAALLRGLPAELWQFETPRRAIAPLPGPGLTYFVVRSADELPELQRKVALPGPTRQACTAGYQQVWRLEPP